jgi:hypothetical protein
MARTPEPLQSRPRFPLSIIFHYADLEPQDVKQLEGIPVTTAARTIRDVHASHLGPALVGQAIADGRRTGHLTFDEADLLEHELLGGPMRSPKKRPQMRRPNKNVIPTRRPPSAPSSSKQYLRNTLKRTRAPAVVLRHPDADLALTLERALTGDPYQGFSFRRKREPLFLDNGVVNMEFAVSYRRRYRASRIERVRGRVAESDSPHRGIRGHRPRRPALSACAGVRRSHRRHMTK